MDVLAEFELPVPIWMMTDALNATYQTGYGELRFTVVMPVHSPPIGEAPATLGLELGRVTPGEQTVWATEYAAYIPESLRPAVALHRIVVAEVQGPTYESEPWFTPDQQLAEFIGRWFDNVRTWVEIVTGQDLDPNHRVYDAESIGIGLSFIKPEHTDSLGLTITTPRIRPLRAVEWSLVLERVGAGDEPPLEEVLSRDARAAHRRGSYRRAIIDAATALEIALGRYVRGLGDQLPEKQRKRIGQRTALGDYISIADFSGLSLAVPVDQLRQLNHLRNDAAHRGNAPGYLESCEAVQTMIDFLGAHGRVRRTGEHERDGSEWIPVEDSSEGRDRLLDDVQPTRAPEAPPDVNMADSGTTLVSPSDDDGGSCE